MKNLILYTKVGGGHLSCANALKKELETQGHQVELLDVFENKGSQFLERTYVILTNNFPLIWNFLVWASKPEWVRNTLKLNFELTAGSGIDAKIKSFSPDKVISTYYFGAEYVAKKHNLPTAVFVCDTLSPHPIWFQKNTRSKYLVCSQKAREIAEKSGAKNIFETGFVFNQKFEKPMTPSEIAEFKKTNNLKENVILAIGGGSSFPKAKEFLKSFLESDSKSQLVMICGKDQSLKIKLEILAKNDPRVRILGFSKEVYEYMNCSDLIVAKGGPAVVFEAIALKKPLFILHYIWEQELGNVDFVVENKLGLYLPEVYDLLQKIREFELGKLSFDTMQIQNHLKKIISEILKA